MTLKLVLPFLERGVEWARVARWHKREGEHMSYGETVCDVVVEEILRHAQPPQGVGSILDAPPGPIYRVRHRGVEFRVSVIASDAGWMRRICVPEGETGKVGDVLALVTTAEDEAVSADEGSAAPAFRAVANLADREDDLAAVLRLADE